MESKKPQIFNYIMYLSIIYIFYYLTKSDFLHFPKIVNKVQFIFSLVSLTFGVVLLEAYSWNHCIKNKIPDINFKDSISATGMTVFGKYIPGKVWGIAGRSDYISKKYNYDIGDLLKLSFNFQILVIWVGLIFGFLGLIILKITLVQLNSIAYLAILLSFGFFSKKVQSSLNIITEFLFKRNFKFISPSETIRILPIITFSWFIISLSFYFFVQSLNDEKIDVAIGLIYPLGVTIGVLSILVPGGLGVREGIFAFLLDSVGFSIEFSLTISIFSRLWSIMADSLFFLIAFIYK